MQILYVGLLCALVTITAAAGGTDSNSKVDQTAGGTETSPPHTLGKVEDELTNLFQTSKNKFLLALFNLSSYLPLNVEYATTVGPECDVNQYNKDYYSRTGVIIASVMFVLGIVFCFFGKQTLHRCTCGPASARVILLHPQDFLVLCNYFSHAHTI